MKYRRAKPKIDCNWSVDPLKSVIEKDYVHSNKKRYPCRRKSFKRKSIDEYWELNQTSNYSLGQSPGRSPTFPQGEIPRNRDFASNTVFLKLKNPLNVGGASNLQVSAMPTDFEYRLLSPKGTEKSHTVDFKDPTTFENFGKSWDRDT